MDSEIMNEYPVFTDAPRQLSAEETIQIERLCRRGRVEAVKFYRAATNSTLAAAVRFVDGMRDRLTRAP